MAEKVTLTEVRCSACEMKFTVLSIDTQQTMECPHCHEKYFLHNTTWHNEKLRELVTRGSSVTVSKQRKKIVKF